MSDRRPLHLAIDLAVSVPSGTIAGRVVTRLAEQPFSGWLQLLTILQADIDRVTEGPQDRETVERGGPIGRDAEAPESW